MIADWAWITILAMIVIVDLYLWRAKQETLSGSAWRRIGSLPLFFRILIAFTILLLMFHIICPWFHGGRQCI